MSREVAPVLITGAGRGIGRAIALKIAEAGLPVVIGYQKNEEAAGSCRNAIEGQGGQAWTLKLDVGDIEAVEGIENALAGVLGSGFSLYGIVNNAGIGSGAFATTSPEAFDGVIAANVRGPFFLVQKLAGRLMKGGSIVNISSGLGSRPHPSMAAYSLSKAAINALTLLLAIEFGERGIRVNAVAPGWTETEINSDLLADPNLRSAVICKTLFGRLGTPDDVAGLVAYLVSDDSRWVTGQVVGCSGGFGLRG